MKPELELYDATNQTHRRLIDDLDGCLDKEAYPHLKVYVYNLTGEVLFLNFVDAPSIVWIEHMYIYKSKYEILNLMESMLKDMKIVSVRHVFSSCVVNQKEMLIRNTNALVSCGFRIYDVQLQLKRSHICFFKTLNKRGTASSTALSSIKEDA
jgi:hypothetical protein